MNATQEPPAETLELVPDGEPIPTKQLAPYDEYRTKIENLKKTAETITVTDISQTAEMKIARATRLSLKEIRVAIQHRHKELKAGILEEGRKLDDGKNQLLEILEPLELRLKDQEDFIERETTRLQNEKRTARTAEITPFLSAVPAVDLGTLTDDQYAAMLTDAKDAHAARLAREQKAKEEAAAKLKAEAEERERVRLELIELKKQAEAAAAEKARLDKQLADERKAAEDAARAEREAAAAALAAAQDKARKEAAAAQKAREEEQAKFEAEARKERERVAAEQEAERQRVAHEQHTAELKAKKERDEIETKARAEREAIEAKAKADRAKFDEEARKQREAREKIEAELAAKKAAEEKAEADRLAAIEAAALAPEKEKLTTLAATVRALALPTMTTEKGLAVLVEIEEQVAKFAKYIEKKAATL